MLIGTSEILEGDVLDCLGSIESDSIHCVVTSPPYWHQRDYGVEGMIGLEATPDEYVAKMVEVFAEVRRVLRKDGVCWLNLGDSYTSGNRATYRSGAITYKYHQIQDDMPRPRTPTGLKPKDLCGIPWRVAFALQADGWWLRDAVIWAKPNPMPSSQRDRCTSSYEFVFQLTKSSRYYFDQEGVREPSIHVGRILRYDGTQKNRNHENPTYPGCKSRSMEVLATRIKRNVWTIPTQGYGGVHFVVFPEKLVEPCILAGTSAKGCCPECGAPWKRIVERDRRPTRPGRDSKLGDTTPLEHGNRDPKRNVTTILTIGWEPMCDCEDDGVGTVQDNRHEPIPCTVLDPFVGSGTTLIVSEKLGRSGIGIELNPKYVQMSEQRIHEVCGLWA